MYKKKFSLLIGSHGRGSGEFLNPQSVCLTEHLIYITDSSNQKIDVFDYNCDFKFSFSSKNRATIRRPIGIVASLDGEKMLVSDYEGKCVNVFNARNGKFLHKTCENKLLGPKGVFVTNQNEILVADSKGNAIFRFDFNGKFLKKFGSLGNGDGNFSGPQYVCCNRRNGEIVVSDFYNHCVKVFDLNGNFKLRFGANGNREGQFNGPTGIAIDNFDNIIVVDWGNARVQVFDKNGDFLKIIDTGSFSLYGPQNIALFGNKLSVVDSGHHCVRIILYNQPTDNNESSIE